MKNAKIISFLVCCALILSSNLCYAQAAETESYSADNIVGGVKIVNGVQHKMTQQEAQAEFLAEKDQSSKMEPLTGKVIQRIVVKTTISSVDKFNGTNVRISPILHNNTKSMMSKTLTGSYTYSAEVTSGFELKTIAKEVNANFSGKVGTSATKSDTTKCHIRPGERFYITFTPKLAKVKGKQLMSLPMGNAAWKEFSGTFPVIVSDQLDGNIYYITK